MGEEFYGELSELVAKYRERGMADVDLIDELDFMTESLADETEQAA